MAPKGGKLGARMVWISFCWESGGGVWFGESDVSESRLGGGEKSALERRGEMKKWEKGIIEPCKQEKFYCDAHRFESSWWNSRFPFHGRTYHTSQFSSFSTTFFIIYFVLL